MIKYTEDSMHVTEDGFYLCLENGRLTVAKANVYHEGEVSWDQLGIDYDCWSLSYHTDVTVKVICRLDLETIASGVEEQP